MPLPPLCGIQMKRHFANWLTAYASYTSDSESPAEFHFWSGVWTVAGALRRRVWIDMRKFQWTPNFYVVLVGPPGIVTKSTSSRIGTRLLERIKGIHFGPPSITWQKLADSLSTAVEHMKTLAPDGTEQFIPMSCLNISVSELGTFLKMEDTSLIDVLVDLWDGQLTTWGHSTKTSGTIDIRNPWLNIIGCTTPAWLRSHFPEHLVGGGLTSRIIFVYGDKKQKLVPYPDELKPSADYQLLEAKLIEDLQQISEMSGEFQLTTEARQWGHDWYTKHWNGRRDNELTSERYSGYLARKQTHLHKVAIVLAAARSSKLIIEKEDLRMADELLRLVEPHMLKVFESIGVVDEAKHVHEILPFVRAHGFLTPDELWQKVMNLMSQRDFEDAVRAAHRGGLLKVGEKNGKRGLVPGEMKPRGSVNAPSS